MRIRTALILLAMAALLGVAGLEAWWIWGPGKREPIWQGLAGRLGGSDPAAEPAPETLADQLSRVKKQNRPAISAPRHWTSVDGRTLEAVATAVDDRSIQLRVLPLHQVYTVPLARLSAEDRAFADRWRSSNPSLGSLPEVPPAGWPTHYDAAPSVEVLAVSEEPGNHRWQSRGYEFRCATSIETPLIFDLARICESIDGLTRIVPLPLRWGRPETERRVIVIHPSKEAYLAAKMLPNSAGAFVLLTGHVHVCLPMLFDDDWMGWARGFQLEKRQTFAVLVHELIHQSTPGIVYSDCPAWAAEGLADYFAALQFAPGRFRFRETHVPIRDYVIDRLGADGVIELKTYRLWKLESFLNRPLAEWNLKTATQARSGAGTIQYVQALLLVDYFCQADSLGAQSFRSYLEAVVTGADPREAASRHLLRGRSHAELEQSIAAYWSQRGCQLAFESSPAIRKEDLRLGVGLRSRLRGG